MSDLILPGEPGFNAPLPTSGPLPDNILYTGSSSSLRGKAEATLTRWRLQPETFVSEMLKVDTIEPWQLEALRGLAMDDCPHISVRSGHGVGKSAWLSWTILWFITTHFPCKIPVTAPTAHQIHDVLWGELSLWKRRMGAVGELFELTNDRLFLKAAPQEAFAVARTARAENPDALQGFHSENILFVVDEASGVPDQIFLPLEGALSTPGARSIMCANPTRCTGYFYDSHNRNRAQFKQIKVSCEDSSRVSPAYIKKMAEQYGENSNVYRVRVLGEFPHEEADVLIPMSIVEPAVGRDVEVTEQLPIWGFDPARYGPCLNALAKRKGNHLLEPIKTRGQVSLMESVGWLMTEYERTPIHMRPHEIIVDVCGLGAGVVDRGLELGLPIIGINAGEAPPRADAKRLSRMRDWLWWQGREWFMTNAVCMPEDRYLMGELSDVHYALSSNGKITVESKRDMLDRGVASPDRADAFLLTFAGSVQTLDREEAKRYTKGAYRKRRTFMGS